MLTDDFFLGTKLYQNLFIDWCKPLADYMGITHAIYVNVDKHGRTFNVCTHSKWIERVIEKEYYKLNLLMVSPQNMHNGFCFDQANEDQEYKDILVYDAATNFNWCCSFAYVEKTSNGGYWAVDLGTTKDNYLIANRLINEASIVKKLLRDLHKNINLMVKNLEESRMDFAALKGELFYSQRGLVFNEQKQYQEKVDLLKQVGFLKNVSSSNFLNSSFLSPQETNCLKIYVNSPNIKAVARELGLAASTVTSYLENIKNKLECYNKQDLLEKSRILESLGYL